MASRLIINLLLPLLVVGALWLWWPRAEPMPAVTFNLIDGRKITSEELRGKSVLVNFWSVSCAVCLRDMPGLTRLHETLRERNFMVLGVAMPHDPPPAVIATVERMRPGYPVALDVHGELAKAFGDVQVTPTSFLIAPDGSINFAQSGPLDEVRVRATVATF